MAYVPGIGEPAVYPSSLSPEICKRKAQDCLALAEKAPDPKHGDVPICGVVDAAGGRCPLGYAARLERCPLERKQGLTAGQPHQARLTQWRLALLAQLGGRRVATADCSVALKKTKPVMWAGRLGWPPHPCPCRSALQKLCGAVR